MTKLNPQEADVKIQVKRLLDKHGWYWWMPPANQYSKVGISDFNALKSGLFLAVEVKLKKTTGSVNQERFMQDIRDNGGLAVLVNMATLPGFAKLLERIDAGYC